jgi:hypothetical protein
MPSLTSCLKLAGDILPSETRAAILARADELRRGGMDNTEASRQAVADTLAGAKSSLSEVETALKDGATLYEVKPETPAAAAEQQAAPSRVDQAIAAAPDMMVKLDDMPEPMRAADFMAMVRAEADEMVADAPLMQIAAECALSIGTGS